MSDDACPIPIPPDQDEQRLIELLLRLRTIAVVGASDNPTKPANYVPAYLQQHGYQIMPVNPNHRTVLGQVCYPLLRDVPLKIDLVNVFRRPVFCPDVVRQAITIGAKGVWLQSGIHSAEAERLALDAGLIFIQDRCLMVEHRRRAH